MNDGITGLGEIYRQLARISETCATLNKTNFVPGAVKFQIKTETNKLRRSWSFEARLSNQNWKVDLLFSILR